MLTNSSHIAKFTKNHDYKMTISVIQIIFGAIVGQRAV